MTTNPTPETAAEERVARYLFDREWTRVVDFEAAREVISLAHAASAVVAVAVPPTGQTAEVEPYAFQVWPLARVLAEVRCGSQDWTWDEEWVDLDARHAETGYLDRLEREIKSNGITMPVLIGTDGRLWDGHHRLRIAVRLGIDYVPVEVPSAGPVLPPPADQAALERVRAVLETEAVVGRSALEYRGLITSALMADEAQQQPETQAEPEAHPPTHTWTVESPRRDTWASWGATYEEREWAQERCESAIENAPQRPFRLVRATTTYTVEVEHQPAAASAGAQTDEEN